MMVQKYKNDKPPLIVKKIEEPKFDNLPTIKPRDGRPILRFMLIPRGYIQARDADEARAIMIMKLGQASSAMFDIAESPEEQQP